MERIPFAKKVSTIDDRCVWNCQLMNDEKFVMFVYVCSEVENGKKI